MNPSHVSMALSAIQLVSNAIQSRMNRHNEMIDLFNKAIEEDRDFTAEEVAIWEAKAQGAIDDLDSLIEGL